MDSHGIALCPDRDILDHRKHRRSAQLWRLEIHREENQSRPNHYLAVFDKDFRHLLILTSSIAGPTLHLI